MRSARADRRGSGPASTRAARRAGVSPRSCTSHCIANRSRDRRERRRASSSRVASTSNSMRWRNRPAAGSECWSASTMLPPASATNAPTARDDARTVGALEQEHGAHVVPIGAGAAQNSVRSGSTSPRSRSRSISTQATPLLSAYTLAWGLICCATNMPDGRRELRVAVEPFLVAQQLVDAGDLADALHLDDDRAAVAVAAQQVDRADVGRVLAAHEREVVAQRGDARRDQLLQLGFDAVLFEPGIVAEFDRRVVQDLVQLDAQRLALRRARDDRAVGLLDRARRVHPVERLVRLGVGVDRDRAVGLAQHQPDRGREAGAEPAFVRHRAARDEQPHRAESVTPAPRPYRGCVPVASRPMVAILGASGSFYDEVLRELVVRARRRAVRRQRVRAVPPARPTRRPPRKRTVARNRPGSPVRGYRRTDNERSRAGAARADRHVPRHRLRRDDRRPRRADQQVADARRVSRVDRRAPVGPRPRLLRVAPRRGTGRPRGRTRRRAARRSGAPSSFQCSGSDIAGWPVTSNGEQKRHEPAHAGRRRAGSGLSGASSPSRTGGSGLVGHDEDVVVDPPRRDPAASTPASLDRGDVVDARDLATHGREERVHRFELVRDVASEPCAPPRDVARDRGREHGDERRGCSCSSSAGMSRRVDVVTELGEEARGRRRPRATASGPRRLAVGRLRCGSRCAAARRGAPTSSRYGRDGRRRGVRIAGRRARDRVEHAPRCREPSGSARTRA